MPPGTTSNPGNSGTTSASASLFNRSKNFSVTGSTFNIYQYHARGDNVLDSHNNGVFDDELCKLRSASLDTASIDSQAAEDLPSCYKGTREDIILRVKEWIHEDSQSPSLMWLHGPAGAGKTAIGSTIAQLCEEQEMLIAAFFGGILLERERCRLGKTPLPFVSTIARQLVASLPDSLQHIGKCIRRDPSIFSKRLGHQLDYLVVNPLNESLRVEAGSTRRLRLILIDGLNECSPPQYQKSLLAELTKKIENFKVPVRILVISRPVPDLDRHLKSISKKNFQSINLADGAATVDCDIRLFLNERLKGIRERRYMDQSWPTPDDVQTLSKNASGQFLYAAAAITFVDSRKHRADDRLDIFLGRSPPDEQDPPYRHLDNIFNAILDDILDDIPPEDITLIRQILGVLMIPRCPSDGLGTYNSPKLIEDLLQLRTGDVQHVLSNLHSLLRVGRAEDPIEFHHASLVDFLADSTRITQKFGPIDIPLAHEQLARGYYRLLSPPDSSTDLRKCEEYLIPFVAHSSLSTLSDGLLTEIRTFNILSTYDDILGAGHCDNGYIDSVRMMLDRFFQLLGRKDLKDGQTLSNRHIDELTRYIESKLRGIWNDNRHLEAFAWLTQNNRLKVAVEPGAISSEISQKLFRVHYLTLMYFLSSARSPAMAE